MIKRLPSGLWLADIEPVKGRRFRRRFETKAEAFRFELQIRSRFDSGDVVSDAGSRNYRLSDLIDLWYQIHGRNLRNGDFRYRVLLAAAAALSDPYARSFRAHHYLQYRSDRLASGISPKTLNNGLGYLSAVFNQLRGAGLIGLANPLASVRPLQVQERELSFLSESDIARLLDACAVSENPHVQLITMACLATGARWSEIESLTLDRVAPGSVTFARTKSGKVRTVPIDASLSKRLSEHLSRWGRMTSSLGAFRRALARSGLSLPQGQASHALRHSFASHFVMRGGNILVLQRILGHSSVTMTMRYAHLAPDHLQEAVKLNPLSGFRHFFDTAQDSGSTEKKKAP